jgi:short-subunit dehydrogenase
MMIFIATIATLFYYSSGIGASLALIYAKPGVTIGLLGRNTESLKKVAEAVNSRRASAEILVCDVADTDKLAQTLQGFDDRHNIDLLFANAGQLGYTIDTDKEWEDQWDRIIDVNFVGAVATAMTGFKLMEKRKNRRGGQIAITSSISGYFFMPQMAYYNATKAALISFGRDLRYIGRQHNIKVTVVTPGAIDTRMTADPHQPTSLPSWLLAKPEKLAQIIKRRLYYNPATIAYPFSEHLASWVTQSLPTALLDNVTWLVGKVSSSFSQTGSRGFS